MAAQHKQAPVPSFAREKAEELEEMEEEGVEDDGELTQLQSSKAMMT